MDLKQRQVPWQELEVSLGVRNLFLQRNLNVGNESQAKIFLKDCGFDLSNPFHAKQFDQILSESVFFIRHVLMTASERNMFAVPSELLSLENPVRLFLFASHSEPQNRYKRLWACALLKVMWVISNLQFSEKIEVIDSARDQIFKKIKNKITQLEDGRFVMEHNQLSAPIDIVEWKDSKTRHSIIMKLLHKPDHIVDEVFDYLGVRFVVQKTNEIPILLKLLIESNIVIPHQIIALRSRNSLLNVKNSKRVISFLENLTSVGIINEKEFNAMFDKLPWDLHDDEEKQQKNPNAFSHRNYRSIQLTVRHLIRFENPVFPILESFANQLYHYTGTYDQNHLIDSVIPKYVTRYFPIEIQVLDRHSYEVAKFGPASHEQYKLNQLKAVREKVLSNLLLCKGVCCEVK